MQNYLLPPFLLSLCFLALFGLAEYLYRGHKIRGEITRKIVHFGTGILTLLFPVFLVSHWQVLFLCGSFLLLLIASMKLKLLPSINAIDRVSYGSLLFPVAVYVCHLGYFLADKGPILFYLPILILAICDPLAALVGKRWPRGRYRVGRSRKTLSGSLAFFVASVGLSVLLFHALLPGEVLLWRSLLLSVLLSIFVTVIEAVSGRGTDNLTIPLGAVLALYLML